MTALAAVPSTPTAEQLLDSAPTLAVQHEALVVARGQRYADTWLADMVDLAARGIDPDLERRHLRNWSSDALDAFRGKARGARSPKLAYGD